MDVDAEGMAAILRDWNGKGLMAWTNIIWACKAELVEAMTARWAVLKSKGGRS